MSGLLGSFDLLGLLGLFDSLGLLGLWVCGLLNVLVFFGIKYTGMCLFLGSYFLRNV